MSAKRGGVYIAMNIITVFQINNTYVLMYIWVGLARDPGTALWRNCRLCCFMVCAALVMIFLI